MSIRDEMVMFQPELAPPDEAALADMHQAEDACVYTASSAGLAILAERYNVAAARRPDSEVRQEVLDAMPAPERARHLALSQGFVAFYGWIRKLQDEIRKGRDGVIHGAGRIEQLEDENEKIRAERNRLRRELKLRDKEIVQSVVRQARKARKGGPR